MTSDIYVSFESDFPTYVDGLTIIADPSGENLEITESDLDDEALIPASDSAYDGDFSGIDADGDSSAEGTGADVTLTLLPPEDITVVSQTVRQGAGGVQVVDVVIGFTDSYGASNYEIRVTKN